MSAAVIVANKPRNGNQCGDPRESELLRPLFLAWVGKRSNAEGLRAAGILPRPDAAWLQGTGILDEVYQQRVRDLLAANPPPVHRRLTAADLDWARREGWAS